ncbi:Anti-prolifrtn domain-containing protein [Mycena venus]|uniref:Anti-prolifrtn domain-containing protein n=1 Tax=Mycena venus TaxID=2733690 RepID=A0A8H7CJF3_9AGAR|nr:Anti-prolifrtn domain-containing protein [Mycena venus]
MSASSSLSATVAHAVSFLTRPLLKSYAPATIVKLQLVLEANLTALYAQSWDTNEPLRGSGRRCLTLSPDCPASPAPSTPPREFDFFVDPGCVSMRLDRTGPSSQLVTIWADEIPSPTVARKPTVFGESRIQASINQQVEARARAYAVEKQRTKTVAQQLLEEDSESDEQIFTMIADEICAPTWMTPVLAEFPKPRSLSPLSAISSHSRSSSRSSNSSSGFSFSRAASAHGRPAFSSTPPGTRSPLYDGGKTTVLTGAVMLGCPTKKAVAPRPDHGHGWRSTMRI